MLTAGTQSLAGRSSGDGTERRSLPEHLKKCSQRGSIGHTCGLYRVYMGVIKGLWFPGDLQGGTDSFWELLRPSVCIQLWFPLIADGICYRVARNSSYPSSYSWIRQP